MDARVAPPHLKNPLTAHKLDGARRSLDSDKLWKRPPNRDYVPCAEPSSSYTTPLVSRGYLLVHANGGLNQMRAGGSVEKGKWESLQSGHFRWDLSNNHIGGPIPNNLPITLMTFDLSDNQYSGRIPDTLYSLGQLEKLSLKNNLLAGPIPDVFESFTALTSLWVFLFLVVVAPITFMWKELKIPCSSSFMAECHSARGEGEEGKRNAKPNHRRS